jgi:hypothetical protein
MPPSIDTPIHAQAAPPDEQHSDGHELVMYLERDQLVLDKAHPVPRARLSRRARAGLWALRVFVIVVSAMVIYTFASQVTH